MSKVDLLELVRPADGWVAIVGIKGETNKQVLVETREEFNELAERFLAQQRDVYFSLASFSTGENRTKANVKALKAFWLDLDCGEAKAIPNQTTGRPDGYIDQATAFAELRRFCQETKLPKPTIVNSGRGLHVYWPLISEVSREEWEPVAGALRSACIAHNLYADLSVFEVSRILRVPGTYNFKGEEPTEVSILSSTSPTEFTAFRDALGVKEFTATPAPKRELSALAKSMMDTTTSSFAKIMRRSAKGEGCPQLLACYQERETLSEPRWFNALSVAKFCEDAGKGIHKLSEGYEGYDAAATEQKIAHILGPHTCEQFESNNPGWCEGCKHFGKIKSPIVLGKVLQEPEPEVDEEGEVAEVVNALPFPYVSAEDGGIWIRLKDDEKDPIKVYEHGLWVKKLMHDPVEGFVAVLAVELPMEGVREFTVPNQSITDFGELRKTLSGNGIVCGKKQFELVLGYIITCVKELQYKQKAEEMRLQFGWTEKLDRFIIGDREIRGDGIYHSPPSIVTSTFVQYMQPTGSLAKWKEVFALYGREGMEAHAFGALTAFGAPLLKFTGHHGAIINLIHPESGTGKSTVLYMCNSVYGHPDRLCAMWDDTFNAKMMRLGIMNNLPFCVDEITNTPAQDFSKLAYNMSQGRGKDRVEQSSNKLRKNLTSWQTISLCSSNASFYEKLASLKNSPEGEMMRLLEYKIEPNACIDTAEAKQMFDHQLKENYGLAGDVYATYVLNNLEEVQLLLAEIQRKLDMKIKFAQKERFWSATVAANIAGGLIAKRAGLIDWDIKNITKWVVAMLSDMRVDVRAPAEGHGSIVADYILRHMNNILVVNGEADKRNRMTPLPITEPRGELRIRYEPDTKLMYIVNKHFKEDCTEVQIDYKGLLARLEMAGVLKGVVNKRIAKGMSVASPPVRCLELDCSGEDFIDVEDYVNVGGEGELQRELAEV